ncbi:SipW-dependent-type signal peptide-containing protein [Brevibacterium sp. 'Marine']|uniref:SipW-dependent-type signal peptide-containing protein n=1 Tax=Brevibacterium sp. 'Marine' TaxID=2725563 RepID=UPI00145D86E8|nr:SipW-dependent-type signal peptide-containing protein [Brevibacterium sp. 'Marine']
MPFHFSSLRRLFSTGRVPDDARPVSRRQMRARRQLRGRRIKAILAGGLVFGVGATATVAAWTDIESADGSFEAGTFNIELSIDDQWTSTNEMTFDSAPMFPGSKVYAPVFARTSPDTSIAGALTVRGNGIDSLNAMAGALKYRAVTQNISAGDVSGFACGAGNFNGSATYVFGGESSTVALTTANTSTNEPTLEAASASIQAYCFEVSLPSDASTNAQGQSATHTWTFDAESVAPEN